MKAKPILEKLSACDDAILWADERTPKKAWIECERADWLLWLAGNVEIDRKLLVRAACACARTSLHLIPVGENRPRIAIETAERWCNGEATIEEVVAGAAAGAVAGWAAGWAAGAAAAGDSDSQKIMCKLVRELISWPTIEAALKANKLL